MLGHAATTIVECARRRAHPCPPSSRKTAPLAGWLLGQLEAPPTDLLRKAGLAAYAYVVLPPEHPYRAELRPDYLASLGRHNRIKQEIVLLLRVWREAGIEALLFKEFYLSEFVYPVPGSRFHRNVDVLLRPQHLAGAARIAERLGWNKNSDSAEDGRPYSHDAFTLNRAGGAGRLDVHRHVLHQSLPWTRAPRRVTEAVWRRSRERAWEGINIREMDPADALLVGLVLQRCWGADPWQLQPHDAVDFRLLSAQDGARPDALARRARELDCERTFALFLERCDPGNGHLNLDRPSLLQRCRWDVTVAAERAPPTAERWLVRLMKAPGTAVR